MTNKLDPTDPRVTLEEVETHEQVEQAGSDRPLHGLFNEVSTSRVREMLRLLQGPVRAAVFTEIDRERERQDAQWGGPSHDDEHEPGDWADLIGTHASGLVNTRIWLGEPHRSPVDDYRDRLVKIAALAVAAIESHDRKEKR